MASYGAVRVFWPAIGEMSTAGPNGYDAIANFLDDDDTSRASSSSGNAGIDKLITFLGFSDGLNPHTGAATLFIDHEVLNTTAFASTLLMEYSINDGGAWTTFENVTGIVADIARVVTRVALNVPTSTPQADIQLRLTFNNGSANVEHRVYEVFAGEGTVAGIIF